MYQNRASPILMILVTFHKRITAHSFKINFYLYESIEHKAQRIKMVQNRASPILMILVTFHKRITEGYTTSVLYSLCFKDVSSKKKIAHKNSSKDPH
jgi:hypothetical protein